MPTRGQQPGPGPVERAAVGTRRTSHPGTASSRVACFTDAADQVLQPLPRQLLVLLQHEELPSDDVGLVDAVGDQLLPPLTSAMPARSVTGFSPIGSATKLRALLLRRRRHLRHVECSGDTCDHDRKLTC